MGIGVKWPVRTRTVIRSATSNSSSTIPSQKALLLTLVVVLEEKGPAAGVESRRRGLGLDGVVLLGLLGHGVFGHCEQSIQFGGT